MTVPELVKPRRRRMLLLLGGVLTALVVLSVPFWWQLEAQWFVHNLRDKLAGADIVDQEGDLEDGLRLRIRTTQGELVVGDGGDEAFTEAKYIWLREINGDGLIVASYRLATDGNAVPHSVSITAGLTFRDLVTLDGKQSSAERPDLKISDAIHDLPTYVREYGRVAAIVHSLPVCPESTPLDVPGWVSRGCRVPPEKQRDSNNIFYAEAIHERAEGKKLDLLPPLVRPSERHDRLPEQGSLDESIR